MCLTACSIWSGVSASPKAGMCRSSARIGPPRWTTAAQSASGSTVFVAQSVKSGNSWPFGQRQLEPDHALRRALAVEAVTGGARGEKICSPVRCRRQRVLDARWAASAIPPPSGQRPRHQLHNAERRTTDGRSERKITPNATATCVVSEA